MIICNRCSQKNDDGSPACVNCGERLDILGGKATYIDTGGPGPSPANLAPQPQARPQWADPPMYSGPPAMPVYQPLVPVGIHCPHCRTPLVPVVTKKISVAGWVTFAALFFFCLPLCWIGLLLTEEQRACGTCGGRVF